MFNLPFDIKIELCHQQQRIVWAKEYTCSTMLSGFINNL